MEAFCDQHAPGLFGQLSKGIVNDEKEKPSKKHLKIQKTRGCVNVTQFQFLLQSGISHIYMCFLFLWKTPMLLPSFPVLIYSCTEKGQPPILLKSEIDSTSYKIPKLVQTIIMFTLQQIFKRKKTVLLKELVKRFVCVC